MTTDPKDPAEETKAEAGSEGAAETAPQESVNEGSGALVD